MKRPLLIIAAVVLVVGAALTAFLFSEDSTSSAAELPPGSTEGKPQAFSSHGPSPERRGEQAPTAVSTLKPGELRGVVLTEAGAPVAGAEVVVMRVPAEEAGVPECADVENDDTQCMCGPAAPKLVAALQQLPAQLPVLAQQKTADDGSFHFENLPRALDYRVRAKKGELVASDRPVVGEDSLTLWVAPLQHVSVVVSTELAERVAGATVLLLGEPMQRKQTDSNGRVELLAARGDAEVIAFKDGTLPGSAWLRPGDPEEPFDADVDLTLPATRRISGRVVIGDKPAPGATVSLQAGSCQLSTLTGADGRFGFESVPAGPHTLTAMLGLNTGAADVDVSRRDAANVTLVMTAGGRIVGRVIDAETGDVLGEAAVTATSDDANIPQLEVQPDGTFDTGPIAAGTWELLAAADGFASSEHITIELKPGETRQLDLLLERGALVQGIVLDAERHPVDGAQLTVFRGEDEVHAATTVEKDGRFAIDDLAPGTYRVEVTHRDFRPYAGPLTAPSSNVELVLDPGAVITGEVREEDGTPVPGVRVDNWKGERTRRAANLESHPAVETDKDGRFTFGGLSDGTWRLKPTKFKNPTRTGPEVSVSLGAHQTAHVKLTLQPIARVSGLVIDTKQRPVPNADVRAHCSGMMDMVKSDSVGRFTLTALTEGDCFLMGSAPGYRSKSRQKFSGATKGETLTVVLERAAVVRGTVVDEAGKPIARFWVGSDEFHDGTGRFEVNAWPQERSINARDENLAPEKLAGAPIEGPDVEAGTIVLRPGRVLSGIVRDAKGAGIGGVHISSRARSIFAFSEDDGHFTLKALPPEELDLIFEHREHVTGNARVGAQQTAVEVTLSTGGTLRGLVLDSAGVPERGISVAAGEHNTSTEDDGTFVLPGLKPGSLKVEFFDPDRLSYVAPQVVTLTPDREATLTVRTRPMTGVVVLKVPPGTRPYVRLEASGEYVFARQEWANDTVTLTQLPVGRITLIVGAHREELDVPSGQPVYRAVDLAR